MRSRISVLAAALLGVVASGCTYGSAMEAETACREWMSKGGTATFKAEGFYDPFRINSIRVCVEERQTSQWLGLSRLDVEPGEVVGESGVRGSRVRRLKEVSKRFRYPSR